jgi:hypothetical protein
MQLHLAINKMTWDRGMKAATILCIIGTVLSIAQERELVKKTEDFLSERHKQFTERMNKVKGVVVEDLAALYAEMPVIGLDVLGEINKVYGDFVDIVEEAKEEGQEEELRPLLGEDNYIDLTVSGEPEPRPSVAEMNIFSQYAELQKRLVDYKNTGEYEEEKESVYSLEKKLGRPFELEAYYQGMIDEESSDIEKLKLMLGGFKVEFENAREAWETWCRETYEFNVSILTRLFARAERESIPLDFALELKERIEKAAAILSSENLPAKWDALSIKTDNALGMLAGVMQAFERTRLEKRTIDAAVSDLTVFMDETEEEFKRLWDESRELLPEGEESSKEQSSDKDIE